MLPMDIFLGCGVEILLAEPDDFLRVRESLTRIGYASKTDNILYQSCHILHKRGRYAIVHFKELFKLDGRPTDITENDLVRRNSIAKLLSDWGLLTVVGPEDFRYELTRSISQIKIIKHHEKSDWVLVTKYNIGPKKR